MTELVWQKTGRVSGVGVGVGVGGAAVCMDGTAISINEYVCSGTVGTVMHELL